MSSTYIFSNGYTISRIIKGGWQLSSGHSSHVSSHPIDDMITFARGGITTFDCADIYTGVEELIGEFRDVYLDQYGIEANAMIKIHTKCVPDYSDLAHVDERYIEGIIDRSLQRLRMQRLDLVQFHWWDYGVPGFGEAMQVLQRLQKKGKISQLGVTNTDTAHLQLLVDEGIKIITNQVQYSVIDQRPRLHMVEFCRKHDIALLCYGSVMGGFLSERYLGKNPPVEPYENRSLRKYMLVIEDAGGWEIFQHVLTQLQRIANRHRTDIATIASSVILHQDQVAGVIIGARNTEHVESNMMSSRITLTRDDRVQIKSAIDMLTPLTGDCFALERDKTGKHGSIMKYNLNKE